MNDQGHIDELKAQIEDLTRWLDDARETLRRTRENNQVQLEGVLNDAAKLRRKIDENNKLIRGLQNGRDDFKRVAEEKEKECENLRGMVVKNDTLINSLRNEKVSLEVELEKLRNMVATKDGQIGSLRNDKGNLEQELEEANKKITG